MFIEEDKGAPKSCLTRPGFCGLYVVKTVNKNQKRHLSFAHYTSFLPGMFEGQREDTGMSRDEGSAKWRGREGPTQASPTFGLGSLHAPLCHKLAPVSSMFVLFIVPGR